MMMCAVFQRCQAVTGASLLFRCAAAVAAVAAAAVAAAAAAACLLSFVAVNQPTNQPVTTQLPRAQRRPVWLEGRLGRRR